MGKYHKCSFKNVVRIIKSKEKTSTQQGVFHYIKYNDDGTTKEITYKW